MMLPCNMIRQMEGNLQHLTSRQLDTLYGCIDSIRHLFSTVLVIPLLRVLCARAYEEIHHLLNNNRMQTARALLCVLNLNILRATLRGRLFEMKATHSGILPELAKGPLLG